MQTGFLRLEVNGRYMPAYLAAPDGKGPFPGVVVAMHIFGLDRFVRGKCEELAEAGFVAVAPYLFHRTNVTHQDLGDFEYEDKVRWERVPALKATLDDNQIIEDMLEGVKCLRAMDIVGPKLGVTGFCIGGRIAYMMATRTDEFDACVDFYGGEVEQAWGDAPSPISKTADLNCAVAGYFGNDDYNPTPAAVDGLEAELKKHGKRYEFVRYDDTNHAFNDPFNKDRWREHAGTDSLAKMIEFFHRELAFS